MDMTPLLFLLGALATARLTRLVVDDQITLPVRAWILRRVKEDGQLAYLITCPWCVSVYVGAAVASVLWAWPAYAQWPAAALAFSYVTGWLVSREGE